MPRHTACWDWAFDYWNAHLTLISSRDQAQDLGKEEADNQTRTASLLVKRMDTLLKCEDQDISGRGINDPL